jgi:hypothetical protein
MSSSQTEVVSLDDSQLVEIIRAAKQGLLLVAPGISLQVAQAFAEQWVKMETACVQVLLDIDPEVCRMGYGTIEAILLLEQTAAKLGTVVHHRPGIRIGLLISDDTTVVYSPTPLLVEKLPAQCPHPNAVRFETLPSDLFNASSIAEEAEDLVRGSDPVSSHVVQNAAQDLCVNPPLKFDLAQKVRVFNSQLEFVEFKLEGLSISRRTVPIPSDLMGLARDPKTQKLLHSTFKLVSEGSSVSGEGVTKLKEHIAKRFLILLPGYGTVILRSNKARFEASVWTLKRFISRFQKRVKTNLQLEVDKNRAILANALAPAVCAKPPERWHKLLGPTATKESVRELLDQELNSAFGSADELIGEMKVRLIFKGVTYESLTDPRFLETARKLIPSLKFLHEEYDAARATR